MLKDLTTQEMEKRTDHPKESAEASKSSSSSPSVGGTLRRVNFDDLAAVMSINENVYGGSDYLPALFYIFLQSKQHAMYIYEDNGKATAFAIYYQHPEDDGLATAMAGRVRQSSQNQGFVNVMLSGHRKLNEKLTKVFYSSLLKPNIQERLPKWKLCDTTNFLIYKLDDRVKIQRFLRSGSSRDRGVSSSEPLSVSFSDGTKWLDASDQLVRFVSSHSGDFVGISPVWQTTRVSRSGLRRMFGVSKCFATFAGPKKEEEEDEEEEEEKSTRFEQRRTLTAFSFSSALQCKLGVNVGVNFYGNDCDVMIGHLAKHLRHYESVTDDDVAIIFGFQFPLTIDEATVQQKLSGDFGPRFKGGDHYSVTKIAHYIVPIPRSKL